MSRALYAAAADLQDKSLDTAVLLHVQKKLYQMERVLNDVHQRSALSPEEQKQLVQQYKTTLAAFVGAVIHNCQKTREDSGQSLDSYHFWQESMAMNRLAAIDKYQLGDPAYHCFTL